VTDLIAITDPRWSDDDLAARAEAMLSAVPSGSLAIQLRDKVRGGGAVLALAERLRVICSRYGAPLYLNDRLDLALAVGADGAHLGESSIDVGDARELLGPEPVITVATHRLDEVDRARVAGATAVLVSPIYATPGKGAPIGPGFLSEAKARAGSLRVYALGGINLGNVAECRRAGADGVAVMRALWDSTEPALAARQFVDAVRADRA
jgi:thiamine-phosphate pyrophosphorylase